MRCEKCGYISFDSQEKCGRCARDLGELAGQLDGTGVSLRAPQWLAGGLAAHQTLADAAEPEVDPVETLVLDPNHNVPVDEDAELAFVLEDVSAPALADVDFGEEIPLRASSAADSPGAAAAGRRDPLPEVDGYGSFDLFDLDDQDEASAAGAGLDPAAEKPGEVEAKAAPAAGYRLMEDISDLLDEAEPDIADPGPPYDPTGLDELVLSLDEGHDSPAAKETPAERPDIPDLGLSLESAEEADEEKDK